MTLYDNDLYQEDLEYVRNLDLPWEKLQEKVCCFPERLA